MDKDSGDNGRVSYIITSGNEAGQFSVGYDSGIVTLSRPMTGTAELEITANDHGTPPRKSSLRLYFAAAGHAAGPPRLLQANPVARISEDAQIGANVATVAGPAMSDQGKRA